MTEKFVYADYIHTAKEMSTWLRTKQNCDLVIALTHMRVPNDRLLAESVSEIDFILGGHDHMYIAEVCEKTGVVVIKSGTDFEEFSDIRVELEISEKQAADALAKANGKNASIKLLYSK